MRTNSMKVLLCKYFTPRVVILRVTNREREREKIMKYSEGLLVSLKNEQEGKKRRKEKVCER